MWKQGNESLIGKCEHHITKGSLSHGGTWTQHNPRVPLGVINDDIKRILLTNLQYYQKFWIQVFSLSWPINSACSFELLLATLLQTLNGKSCCGNRCYLCPPFCNKSRTLLSFLYVHLTQCAKILSKHLEANFKHLFGMELATDVIFLVFSSADNDLYIYVFDTGVGCEIKYVGTTEMKDIPYISARATCAINFKEILILRLKVWMLSFLEDSTYLT